jgi:ribosomal protein L17
MTQTTLLGEIQAKKTIVKTKKTRQHSNPLIFRQKDKAMPQQSRQVRATLRGNRLIEFDALIERLGLPPSAILKLAVRRLAQSELQNQTASLGETREAA